MIKKTFEVGVTLARSSDSLDAVTLHVFGQPGFNGTFDTQGTLIDVPVAEQQAPTTEEQKRYDLIIPGSGSLTPRQQGILKAMKDSTDFRFTVMELKRKGGGYDNVQFIHEAKRDSVTCFVPNRTPRGYAGRPFKRARGTFY